MRGDERQVLMSSRKSRYTTRYVLAAACGFALFAAPIAVAQQQQAPTGAGAGAGAAATVNAPSSGLDALGDDKLLNELATRGLGSLLERALAVNNVAPARRDAIKTLVALRQLGDPKTRMTVAQRRELVQRIAANLEAALPGLNDPQTMTQQASALLQHGVERDVNTLEYWGENSRTQAAVRPVIEATLKLLDRAAGIARQQADAMANAIVGPADPRARQWEELSTVATAAAYTRHMADYYHAIALDRASPQRKEIAQKAIDYLAQFDNADSSVQPVVRLRVAKLHMARGEFDRAEEIFATVAKPDPAIQPAPDAPQQWEARYFGAVADLLAGKPDDAQKALDEVIAWQQSGLPKEKAAQDGASAATSMLQYRILSARADAATDEAAKRAANDKAVALLMDLVKKRPDLQSVIFEQLMPKLPPTVDLKALDPLLLQGFVARADEERLRPDNEPADAKVLQRGLDAAREMLRRRQSIDPQLADAAALLCGFFLDRLGQPAAAAEAFLDYLKSPGPSAPQNQQLALDNALAIIARLRANPATADQPGTVRAYDRFLPVAIAAPFNRAEFAYEYARRLQLTNQFAKAVEYFRKVPPDDKRLAQARFFLMVALQQRLDNEPKLSPAERQQVTAEIRGLVDDVAQRVTAGMNAAPTDAERAQFRSMLVRTLLLSADVARREQNDPRRSLQLLEKFESLSAGLPNEQELNGSALYARVQAYMGLGDSNSATQTLVALLKTRPGGEGAAIVYKLLQRLNDELDQARRAGDRRKMQALAQNRAQLSGFLVEWARGNADPNTRKFTYRYSVFDAATKHLAADLQDDPAQRRAGLQAAMKLYQQLESPQSAELYRATLDPASPDRNYPDPAVSLGIGLISYDLGDFATAQQRLGRLLTDRKLGTPTVGVEENGQSKLVENDQYWEATLKLMRANAALAAVNAADAQAQAARERTTNYLKELYVRHGRTVGGAKWSPEFEKLRQEIAPELNPDEFTVDATAPATQPTATDTGASPAGG